MLRRKFLGLLGATPMTLAKSPVSDPKPKIEYVKASGDPEESEAIDHTMSVPEWMKKWAGQ